MQFDDKSLGDVKRKGYVYFHNQFCGEIHEYMSGYTFRYETNWIEGGKPKISASLPVEIGYKYSEKLFPFFSGLLSEGNLRTIQAAQGKIDEEDDFGLLLLTCKNDTAGAVTVKESIEVL